MKESIFEDRVPEAAARQMAVVLASATEWQLATLEYLQGLKRFSRGELTRQQDLADQLVYHCRDLKIKPRGLRGRECPRLARALTNRHAVKEETDANR